MRETDRQRELRQLWPVSVAELDSLSLLGNPHLDKDTETIEWLEELNARVRAAKGGQRGGTV